MVVSPGKIVLPLWERVQMEIFLHVSGSVFAAKKFHAAIMELACSCVKFLLRLKK